jgi:predicted DCC family thiol-disulfide oxidoreductase YuxK
VSGHVALVLYDADCGLCAGTAAWLAARGLDVAPIRSATGDRELRDLPPARRAASMHVVDTCGRRRSGHTGLAPIARSLHGLDWAARLLEAAPGISRFGYAAVSRNRRALSRLARLRECRQAPALRG